MLPLLSSQVVQLNAPGCCSESWRTYPFAVTNPCIQLQMLWHKRLLLQTAWTLMSRELALLGSLTFNALFLPAGNCKDSGNTPMLCSSCNSPSAVQAILGPANDLTFIG